MNKYGMLKFVAFARASKYCEARTGFKPSSIDIVQKIASLDRIPNRFPSSINSRDLIEHIKSITVRVMSQAYPYTYHQVIHKEIEKIKKNPSKQLPLP